MKRGTREHPHRAQYAIDARAARSLVGGIGLRTEDATAHALLDAADRLRTYAALMEASAVSAARAEGATWDEIGSWLGVSKQSAWERFGSPKS